MEIHIPLSKTELSILENLFKSSLPLTHAGHFDTKSLVQECLDAGFETDAINENIECLIDRGYLTGTRYFGSNLPPHIQFSDSGFAESCLLFLDNYDEIKELVAKHLTTITSQESATIKSIAEALNQPFLVALHFVEFFTHLGWVKMHRENSEFAYITYISPLVKRSLEVKA